MRLAVTKMDSKGRISIPLALRHHMRLGQGDELMLQTQEKELRLSPVGGGNAELNVKFRKSANISESLANVMRILSKNKIDIVNSEVQTFEGHANWRAVVDAADYKKLKNEIAELEGVQDFSLKKTN